MMMMMMMMMFLYVFITVQRSLPQISIIPCKIHPHHGLSMSFHRPIPTSWCPSLLGLKSFSWAWCERPKTTFHIHIYLQLKQHLQKMSSKIPKFHNTNPKKLTFNPRVPNLSKKISHLQKHLTLEVALASTGWAVQVLVVFGALRLPSPQKNHRRHATFLEFFVLWLSETWSPSIKARKML